MFFKNNKRSSNGETRVLTNPRNSSSVLLPAFFSCESKAVLTPHFNHTDPKYLNPPKKPLATEIKYTGEAKIKRQEGASYRSDEDALAAAVTVAAVS